MSQRLHGLLAEFDTAEQLLAAAARVRAAGYRQMDAYSPFPVPGLSEAVGFKRTILPALVLLGGLTGAAVGFGMQYYISVIDYPLNIGGRPLNSWPQFIPVTFELAVLFAAGTAVLGMLALNGLPKPYNPLFNVERFALASHDRFFLAIEASDPQFDAVKTRQLLESLQPHGVYEVED